MNTIRATLLLFAAAATAPPLHAQDVELMAEHYGTRPPAAYYEQLRLDPDAYRFSRGWRSETRLRRPAGPRGGPGPLRILGRRDGPVEGTFKVPLLLGLYSDSPVDPPFAREEIESTYFSGPNPTGTLTDFFDEISFGRVELTAEVVDWVRTGLTNEQVTGTSNGLSGSDGVGEFIIQIVNELNDGGLDWGQFDNDGPDGVPNSGDDDGFVDVLAVMHATSGAECTSLPGDVWSHRWSLAASAGQIASTVSQTPGGENILINDYVIVPSRDCDGGAVNPIGTLAHELGHGFGLPDLYAVGAGHAGIGRWGLMGSGSWGCTGSNPAKPCHMMAWSKEVLGWADVVTLDRGVDHGVLTIDPVEESNRIYRVDAGDGSGDYYLIENRQRIGADSDLYAPGLLIWQIDDEIVNSRWGSNAINSDRDRMGVWLRQADGQNHLARSGRGRGDAGDPFPGESGNDRFHAETSPSARSHLGTTSGVTLLDIEEVGEQIRLRLLARYQEITLRAEGTTDAEGVFTVDGQPSGETEVVFSSAPFEPHVLSAVGGEDPVDGFRNGFEGWDDGAPRVRDWITGTEDVVLVATYGNPEVRFDIALDSPAPGIEPGLITTDPVSESGWISQGTEVTVMAESTTGFAFREWTGALAGQANPFVATIDAPLSAGAAFDVVYGIAEQPMSIDLEAAVVRVIAFSAENANEPVWWRVSTGPLPPGMTFSQQAAEIRGAPIQTGSYPITVLAIDAIGLTAEVSMSLEVSRPSVGLTAMASPFLGGADVDLELRRFLDLQGNRNGRYDLADFRHYVLDNPDAPLAAQLRAAEPLTVPLILREEER